MPLSPAQRRTPKYRLFDIENAISKNGDQIYSDPISLHGGCVLNQLGPLVVPYVARHDWPPSARTWRLMVWQTYVIPKLGILSSLQRLPAFHRDRQGIHRFVLPAGYDALISIVEAIRAFGNFSTTRNAQWAGDGALSFLRRKDAARGDILPALPARSAASIGRIAAFASGRVAHVNA